MLITILRMINPHSAFAFSSFGSGSLLVGNAGLAQAQTSLDKADD